MTEPTPQEIFSALESHISSQIVGQQRLINRLLVTLLADGHLLVEGAPGLAKTRAIKVLADGIEASFHRVQFTPDLLPSDLTGTEVFNPQEGSFHFERGPLFHNLILADEINRAPAKVQSALLEAMAERQITVGKESYQLEQLFLVMATQNPIEQEGTYALPEAQLDRFLLLVRIDYPNSSDELQILRLTRREAVLSTTTTSSMHSAERAPILTQQLLAQARTEVLEIHMAESLEHYIVQLIAATRHGELCTQLQYGASPRATMALDRCARAHAWLAQRDFVSPEDIQQLLHDTLRHRIALSFEAEAEGVTTDQVIDRLITMVPVP
ncbi:MAG: MoxR family ATPase [Mariprofundales bacterium]|nr:MoxR family ATPase [Mariprofundales bacterium]